MACAIRRRSRPCVAIRISPRSRCRPSSIPATTPITQCNPNLGLSNGKFLPRPTGGTSVIEGSVELRVPLMRHLDGAVFVDGAIVGNGVLQGFQDLKSITDFAHGTSAITPGAGIRYNSPVGPIRVD